MVRHVLILLSDQFSRTAHRLISLGWAVILVAGTGTLADITQAFRGLSLLGEEPNIRAWAMVVADTIPILGLGFIVGFACIGIAGYFQERLEHLIRDVVYAVLASAPRKNRQSNQRISEFSSMSGRERRKDERRGMTDADSERHGLAPDARIDLRRPGPTQMMSASC